MLIAVFANLFLTMAFVFTEGLSFEGPNSRYLFGWDPNFGMLVEQWGESTWSRSREYTAVSENLDTDTQNTSEFAEPKNPFFWENQNYQFLFWGTLRNLSNYNELNDDSALNPDNIFQAPEYINLSEARLKLDGSILNKIGFFIRERLQYDISKNSDEVETDFDHNLDQAFASLELGEDILTFWSAGKQRIKWGTGRYWNPVDTFNPLQNLQDLEPIEEGRISYRADIAFPSLSVTGVAVPDIESTVFSLDNFSFQDNTSLLTGKIYTFVWNTDLTLYVSDKEHEATRFGTSFATVISNTQFFGEAIYWSGESEKSYVVLESERQPVFDPIGDTNYVLPAEFGSEKKDDAYYKFVLGLQHTFANDLNLILEYYHRSDGYDQDDWDTYLEFLRYVGGQYQDDVASTMLAKQRNSQLPIPDYPSQASLLQAGVNLYDFARFRRNYFYFSLYWPYLAGNRIDLGLDTIINIDDLIDGNGGSFFIRPHVSYRGFQDWRFSLYSQLYLGAKDTEFGILPYDYGLFFEIKYFF